ncbi:MAG: hypothetical protein OEW19_01405 [Acidobacteriota bacterium]|nr:hypothetical protein [Acidobacteriota bacterium]
MRNGCGLLLMVLWAAPAVAQDVPKDAQIAQALLASPEDRRAGAAVLGFVGGKVEMLRAGSNDLICLADNPAVEGFSVACYHKDLDPFMARGREMTAQGITDDKVRDQTRFDEIKAGTLPMPKETRALYVLTGKSVDAAGKVEDAYTRWVLYVPFATGESTGLPTRPAGPGVPWLMNPGTGGAHIMISPPPRP